MVAHFKCIHLMRLNCTYKISSDGKFYGFLLLITMKKAMNFLTQEKKVNERFGTVLCKNEVSR